ncbi:hypothetical protein PLICRDRAFT_47772 [Plicaturopsis crispa FD-325 SS-3]|nr:hypothetical protein PLICRDRAFT_47772 [Plicaturopsis crispa FD-325 SS-3]
MHLDRLLVPRDHFLALRQSGSNCVTCPDPPACSCAANEDCYQIQRDCNTCYTNKCVARSSSSSGSGGGGGVSKGALGGAVVGVLIFLAGAVAVFLWYRRRLAARNDIASVEAKPDIPADAATVLNRPDPSEKPSSPSSNEQNNVRVYSTQSDTTIDLSPESRGASAASTSNPFESVRSSTQDNPFGDDHSIQTTSTGTQGTNVIPIALVTPGSASPTLDSTPHRPVRSPDLNLNLDHVNVSRDELRSGLPYASSARSGVSGVTDRNSYMSGASYSSDFFDEAPVIVTSNQGAVRQVLGVHKAEMLHTPGSNASTPSTPDSLKVPGSRPSVRSPLATTTFTPADVVPEADEERGQDLEAPRSHLMNDSKLSPTPSASTFGTPEPNSSFDRDPQEPRLPWVRSDDSDRPTSMSTQAGSIIDIGSATRVNVGLARMRPGTDEPPATAQSFPRSPYRTTMGRLVSPNTANGTATLEEQQEFALAHAHAQAQAQGSGEGNRMSTSGSSVISGTSTRADSILESFPFVPPSPISNRPIRSPPRSPLADQTFGGVALSISHPTPRASTQSNAVPESATLPKSPALVPPNRKFRGSVASQASNASTGLGSFPFQIESGAGSESGHAIAPSSFPPAESQGHQRASLDTLALTRDLSSYPLGFDQEARDNYPYKGPA